MRLVPATLGFDNPSYVFLLAPLPVRQVRDQPKHKGEILVSATLRKLPIIGSHSDRTRYGLARRVPNRCSLAGETACHPPLNRQPEVANVKPIPRSAVRSRRFIDNVAPGEPPESPT